eukprot:TRINITY_DN1662_c1_g1_i2.p1 TRINITY_DN1662_c1_g1~~TRINITY_DN1662_c1_g1_i2.p1  ORF type:complete len:221 (+),score=63.87 TRINITY_DN1662_c1_g1_i2:376-1038(+)
MICGFHTRDIHQCPTCEDAVFINTRNRFVLSHLGAMRVLCPNNCGSETVTRDNLIYHIDHCPVPCPKCKQPVAPMEKSAHMRNCPEAMVRCEKCRAKVRRRVLRSGEHKLFCPIECPNKCGAAVAPVKQKEHDEVCPMKTVSCSAARCRCPWAGPRKLCVAHEVDCPYVKLMPMLDELLRHNAALQREVDELTQQLAAAKAPPPLPPPPARPAFVCTHVT